MSEIVLSGRNGSSVRGAILDLSLGGLQVGYLQTSESGAPLVVAAGDTLTFAFNLPTGEVSGKGEIVAMTADHVHLKFRGIARGEGELRSFLESPLAGTPSRPPRG